MNLWNFLRRAAAGALLIGSLPAVTLPVSEDTSSSPAKKSESRARLLPASGRANSLRISSTRSAFFRFEVGSISDELPAAEVTRALLMVYFTKVTSEGSLQLRLLSEDWTESAASVTPAPGVDAEPVAIIPADSVIAKQFAIVDVTEQVKAWLAAPDTDFGFALTADDATNVRIGAKEGPGTGYPAVLQIERIHTIANDQVSAGIDAVKLGDGTVDNVELSYLNGVRSLIQPQLDQLGAALEFERNRVIGNDQLAGGIDAVKLGDGTVDNVELSYLDGVSSPIQPQFSQLGTALEGVSTALSAKVSKSGDTMTGPLFLPMDGVKVGGNQLAIVGGKVGIGTDAPTAALEVRGDVKLGSAGDLQAAGGDEPLRIVRGILENQNGTFAVISGEGFSVANLPSNPHDFEITFSRAFSAPPTVTYEQEVRPPATNSGGGNNLRIVDPDRVELKFLANPLFSGVRLHFVAIGSR